MPIRSVIIGSATASVLGVRNMFFFSVSIVFILLYGLYLSLLRDLIEDKRRANMSRVPLTVSLFHLKNTKVNIQIQIFFFSK